MYGSEGGRGRRGGGWGRPARRDSATTNTDPSAGPDTGAGPTSGAGASGGSFGGRGRKAKDKPPAEPRDPVSHAREICLNLLTMRPRTREELRLALLKREVDEQVAEQVLSRLNEVGLVDDAAFAEQWVRSRHTYQGMARRAMAAELRRKGVADPLAQEAVAAVDNDAEEARAHELVRKKLRTVASVPDETTKIRRLVGVLARKGYSEGLAYRVVREELRNAGDETDLLDTIPD